MLDYVSLKAIAEQVSTTSRLVVDAGNWLLGKRTIDQCANATMANHQYVMFS